MATIRVLSAIVVQSQVVHVPVNLVVGEPECRVSPENCCPSGSGPPGGAGCCYPRPPDRLWATGYGASAACLCLLDCVPLDYDPPSDAWYSPYEIATGCGPGVRLLRLKCVGGDYRLDVVDGDHVVILGGVAAVETSCDPFLVAACFDDPDALVCYEPGQFCYFVVESDCTPGDGPPDGGSGDDGSGSGGGEFCLAVESLSGDCDCLTGTYQLPFVGEVCGGRGMAASLRAVGEGAGYELNLAVGGTTIGGGQSTFHFTQEPPWTLDVGVSEGACVGTIRLTLADGPCGGGGGDGGGGVVDVPCCPDDLVPATLRAVFSDGTDDLVCLDGVGVTLTAAGDGVNWYGTLPASCGLGDGALVLACTAADVGWGLGCGEYGILGFLESASCLPFRLAFVTNAPLAGSGAVRVTVTPAG